ncbi:MAG: hypothetical protein PHG85_04750, partial [Candidatus Altiarchaeota archaeon]|nr:hypothetical protein [Candidatus Altiarchaeota archaeon]
MEFEVRPKRISESDLVTDRIERIDRLQDFLGLNNREFAILAELFRLNNENATAGAQQLSEAYTRQHMRSMSAEEADGIVEQLKKKKLIGNEENMRFSMERLRERITEKKAEGGEKLSDDVINNLEYYLQEARTLMVRPLLLYLPTTEMFSIMAANLKKASKTRLYMTSNFSAAFYTDRMLGIYSEPVQDYFRLIKERSLAGELEVVHITKLDARELYDDALRACGAKKEALQESLRVLESIHETVIAGKNSVYYLNFPFGLDGLLLASEGATEFFLKI